MFALIFGLSFLANAQDVQKDQPKGYQFTDIKRLPATSVKDQARAGTCWSWSGQKSIGKIVGKIQNKSHSCSYLIHTLMIYLIYKA